MTEPNPTRYPAGGCTLTDKTRCTLPHVTCCNQGQAIRWPNVEPLPGDFPTLDAYAAALTEYRARLAAETETP